MKKGHLLVLTFVVALASSCAYPDRYNTQKGALIGAGAGALLGQAIGGNTAGTLIGLGAGTILGGLVGNAVDQDHQAAREAALYEKPVVYYDKSGSAVESVPGPVDQKTKCRTVTNRVWQDGKMVSEKVEEICSDPAPPSTVVVQPQPQYVYPPPYPYPYYYAYPYPYPYPGIYLRFGGPRYRHWHRW
jgi:hypothetical protein